jgi:predicted SprT family Zn-dependent metalloprotease
MGVSESLALLSGLFQQVNSLHFDGFLEAPILRWNSRLRTSAGRFVPGSRKYWRRYPAVIEVASYLATHEKAEDHIRDTLAHEMIHYWLWLRRKPYGHTPEFWTKMNAMGVSRYNPVPVRRPFRYLYRCPACSKEFFAKRTLGILACARCCKTHTGGRYDERFRLFLERNLSADEGLQALFQNLRPPRTSESQEEKSI